jgi:hypothetical protein
MKVLYVLVPVVLITLILAFQESPQSRPAPAPPPPRVVRLIDDDGFAVVFPDVAQYDRAEAAAVAGEPVSIDSLIDAGPAFIVQREARAEVLGEDYGRHLTRVRVIDQPHAGKTGWVRSVWVR